MEAGDDVRVNFDEAILLLKEKVRNRTLLKELGVYILFVAVFLGQLFLARNINGTFQMESALRDLFVEEEFPPEFSHILKNFHDIGSMDEFWQWLQGPFQEAMTTNEWYNGDVFTAGEQEFLYNYNRIIGGFRIRQLRVRDDSCLASTTFTDVYPHCWGYYDPAAASKEAFGPGKKWKYQDPADTKIPYEVGRTDNSYYDGGGFLVDFAKNRSAIPSQLAQLKADKFLDKKTRVIFVTVNAMNGNLGLFMLSKFMVEFTPGGLTAPFAIFKAFKMEPYSTGVDYFRAILELSTIFFLIFFARQEIQEAIETKKVRGSFLYYFEDGWNYLDLINLALLWTVVVVNSEFVFFSNRSGFVATSTDYINLESVADTYYLVFSLQSISVLIVFLKIFKYLQMNAKMSLMWSTIGMASSDLVAFFIFFMIVFLGFTMMGHLLFGSTVEDFRELGLSLITCFKMILGDFNYTEINRANRFLGSVFFILFILLVYFTLANMFLAIINDAYAIVNRKAQGSNLGAQIKKGLRKKLERFRASAMDKEKAISDKVLLEKLKETRKRVQTGAVLGRRGLKDALGESDDVIERLIYIYQNMREKTGRAAEDEEAEGDGAGSSSVNPQHIEMNVMTNDLDDRLSELAEVQMKTRQKTMKILAMIEAKVDQISTAVVKRDE